MWTTIYVTIDNNWAQSVKKLLESEGFLVKMKNTMSDDERLYEILVLQNEAKYARDLMIEKGII